MWDVKVLASGSSGNCIFVSDGNTKLLLDAGISKESIRTRLKEFGECLGNITGIVTTHEHIDHVKCVEQLCKENNLSVFVDRGTKQACNIPSWLFTQAESLKVFKWQGVNIIPFSVVHDALEPMGYLLINSKNEKLLYITDTGTVEHISVKDVDVIIIEANYDENMITKNLTDGELLHERYARTMSIQGHLSIQQTIEFLKRNMSNRTKHIILSHLSSLNANKDDFKFRVIQALQFENVSIAEKGLCVNVGFEANPY